MDASGYRTPPRRCTRAIGSPPRFSPLTIDGTGEGARDPRPGRRLPRLSTSHLDCRPCQVGRLRRPQSRRLARPYVRAARPCDGHRVGCGNHAEIWVVDPRCTETPWLATRHLAPKLGTDHAMLAFLVRGKLLVDGADRGGARARDLRSRRAGRRGRVVHPRTRGPRVAGVNGRSRVDRAPSTWSAVPGAWVSSPEPASRCRQA